MVLDLIQDPIFARTGEMQMALDEVLHLNASDPVLRFYGWVIPTVTFGYFQNINEIERQTAVDTPLVRRWTGGGMVRHGGDFTFSFSCPRHHPLSGLRPVESYRQIHAAVVTALRKTGIEAELAVAESGFGDACFQHPVVCDVLWRGRKIAGGAQRRTRSGLLHQGSIQGIDLSPEFGAAFAAALAQTVRPVVLSPSMLREAEQRAAEKYGTSGWLRLR